MRLQNLRTSTVSVRPTTLQFLFKKGPTCVFVFMYGIALLFFVHLCSCTALYCIVLMLSLATWVPVSFKENYVIINNVFVCNYRSDTNEKEKMTRVEVLPGEIFLTHMDEFGQGRSREITVSVQLIVSAAFPDNSRGVDTASSYQRHRWVHGEGGNKMLVAIGQLMAGAPCLQAPANLRKHSSRNWVCSSTGCHAKSIFLQ